MTAFVKDVVHTDGTAAQTGPYMHKMVTTYYQDMAPYAHLSYLQVFDLLKNIPYCADPVSEETLQRPFYTLNGIGPGGDCDDIAIALASWAVLNGIAYDFVAVRRPYKKKLHHVFTLLYINGVGTPPIPADPTYSFNLPVTLHGHYAQFEILPRS